MIAAASWVPLRSLCVGRAPHAEINLVFELQIEGLAPGAPVEAVEDWIGFRWQPVDRLDEAALEPAPLRSLIAAWLKRPGGHFVSGDAWETEACGKGAGAFQCETE